MAGEKHLLAAIMFSDIVGYTAMMGEKEETAFQILHRNREIQKSSIEKYGGVWLKEMGDGILARFDSALNAILCAKEIQKEVYRDGAFKIRIGIHLGDITVENGDVFGDGVNIASRLQSITDPGGIYVSDSVIRAIRARDEIKNIPIGAVTLKNINYPVEVFAIGGENISIPSPQKIKELSSATSGIRKKRRRWILFILILMIGLGGWLIKKYIHPVNDFRISSIAVLPLSNLTGDDQQQYFVDGMHDALITELSKISSIRTIGRQSTLQYEGSKLPIKAIASQLNVDAIVEGSVYKSGNRVRIQIRLNKIKPKETPLFSQQYDRELGDVLNLQREITKDIATRIQVQLTAGEISKLQEKEEVTPEAYEAYLKGMFHWYKLTRQDLDLAENYFRLALEIDSNFAPAYAGLAGIGVGRMQQGYTSWREAFPVSMNYANKALDLDNTLSEAYLVKGFIEGQSWNYTQARQELKKALSFNPNNATARAYLGHEFYFWKQPEKGKIQMDSAFILDPYNILYKELHGMNLNFSRQYSEARVWLEDILKTSPESPIALSSLRTAYHMLKRYDDALRIWKKSYSNYPEAIEALDKGYADGGYSGALQYLAEWLINRSKTTYVSSWQIGTLYTRAGMGKEALDWLEKAYEEHDPNMPSIYVDPIFDFLRDDPRFKSLYLKMNFPD